MTGEDPLRMWARLRNTREWLVGPLSPDGWAGQVFIADHADIFAFRFLSLPASWIKKAPERKQAEYCSENFGSWFRDWPKWWRVVGPKVYDDSYARLVWQMPDNGPEVTYEWARTGINEVVCRITHSEPAELVIQGYVPWDRNPPQFSVIYSEGPQRRSLPGRSWIPGTRNGMRWVLATSAMPEDVTGTGLARWHGYYRAIKRIYLCGRQGQSYEPLEESARAWLDGNRIDQLLEDNRQKYLRTRPQAEGG